MELTIKKLKNIILLLEDGNCDCLHKKDVDYIMNSLTSAMDEMEIKYRRKYENGELK